MDLNVFNKAMQLAREAHQDLLQDMQGDGRSHFDDEQRKNALALDAQLSDAASRLEAAVARIQGEFDNPYLLKFGPLSIDPAQDIVRILTGEREEDVGETANGTCCQFCDDGSVATRLMPQSEDQGDTVDYVRACDGHAHGWWDAADWNGAALERTIDASGVDPAILRARTHRAAVLDGRPVMVRDPFMVFDQTTRQREVVYCVYAMQSGAKGRHFHGHYFERALTGFSS